MYNTLQRTLHIYNTEMELKSKEKTLFIKVTKKFIFLDKDENIYFTETFLLPILQDKLKIIDVRYRRAVPQINNGQLTAFNQLNTAIYTNYKWI